MIAKSINLLPPSPVLELDSLDPERVSRLTLRKLVLVMGCLLVVQHQKSLLLLSMLP